MMREPLVVEKRTSTLHDFPYEGPGRKCFHSWIVNVAPPGRAHCAHDCTFCYAREAIYADQESTPRVYGNLPELIERDLERLDLVPPVLLCTTTDPCQPAKAVRDQTRAVVALLLRHGISFALITKGDARFLGELSGFWEYERKYISVSIEGGPEVLRLLSPNAAPYEIRIASVREAAARGANAAVRLDPYLVHIFRGLYGSRWWEVTEGLLDEFSAAGARHVTGGTGRLGGRRPPSPPETMLERVLSLVRRQVSPASADEMARDYVSGWSGTCRGYVLRDELRRELHGQLREACEARGMTYASCQELPCAEDSPGIPHCGGFAIPFVRRSPDGRFRPVEGCTANCHVHCAGAPHPPCGQRELTHARPYRRMWLRRAAGRG